MNLRPYQEIGVRFLAARTAALLADEQGLGKTIQAIGAVAALKARKVLVVCPAGLKLNWKREFETWMPVFRHTSGIMPAQERNIQVLFGRKDRIKSTTDVLIVNYDLLVGADILKQILALKFAVGIFDEAHFLKSRSARRTKAVFLKGGVASKCMYKWFLTGTPILNRPVEIYPILKAAAPTVLGSFTSYESFARRYCGGFFDGYQLVAKGATNTDELNERITKDFMLRRLKKDHLKELPDKQYQLIDIEATDAETKKLIEKEFTWSKQDVSYQKDLATGGAELAILRHELARKKVGRAVTHCKDLLDNVNKLIVFAYHKDVIKSLEEGLKEFDPVVINGDTLSKNRQDIVDKFQKDQKCRVFIGQITAAGVGITLTAASTVVFVETSWTPGEIDQATDRAHRLGQKDAVLVQFLVIAGSLEEHILKTVVDKKLTIQKIVDERHPEYIFT